VTPPKAAGKPVPSEDTGIEAELRLIERARVALRNGNPTEALRALDDHAQRFPTGQFATERRHSRIKAQCLAGRDTEAKALAVDPTSTRVFVVACSVK